MVDKSKPPLGIPPSTGDAIVEVLTKIARKPVDIILIVVEEGTNWKRPEIISSVHPDIAEAVIKAMGEQIDDGSLGKRHVHGPYHG